MVQNISAPFICEVPPFKATLDKAIGMADFVFGNETEAEAFAEKQGLGTKDVKEIAKKIAAMPLEGKGKRRVIITQGAAAVIVATAGEEQVSSIVFY